jgi:hypothetical protein
MLSLPQVRDVCLSGQGADECRYLHYDTGTANRVCLKKVPGRKEIIDDQIDKFIAKAKAAGQDPTQMLRPLADNCKGYPSLKHKLQGYDVP